MQEIFRTNVQRAVEDSGPFTPTRSYTTKPGRNVSPAKRRNEFRIKVFGPAMPDNTKQDHRSVLDLKEDHSTTCART